jgi:branched-chain amino acid transport system permease protein
VSSGPLLVVGFVVAVGVLALVGLHADRYTATTLARVLVVGLLAASVALLAGWCGLPSLGQTAPFAAGAYTTGLLAKHHQAVGPLLVVAAAAAGALLAALTGPVVLRTRGTVFLMVTLALGELAAVAAARWTRLTGGTDGLFGIPATRWWPGTAPLLDPRHTYLYVLAVVATVLAATVLVLRSPAGLLLRGTRDNEPRLRAAGHPTGRYLYLAWIAASALAAVGGSLLVTVQRYVSPADAGFDLAALVLLAVVVGGSTSLIGAFAGAALIVVTRDWLAGPWPGHAPLLVGVLLVVVVYALPDGIASLAPIRRRPIGRTRADDR